MELMSEAKAGERADGRKVFFPGKEGFREIYVFDELTPTRGGAMGFAIFERGVSCPLHKHNLEEFFYVIKGRGKATIGRKHFELKPDVCLYAPEDTPHIFTNTGNEKMELLYFLGSKYETTVLE